MFRVRFLLASLLFASCFVTATGGCGTEDEDIWMPPTSEGKADGVQILKGSDIPSQFVTSSKHYLTGRRIDILEQITALKDMPDSVAKRADGIIANLPANGRVEAAELVRMESAQIFPTLFPEEKQALPKLWELLEAPNPNPTSVAVPGIDLTITEQLTQPSGLTVPTSLLISTLPNDQQPVARRVQLVFNADNNAQTIQVADIDKVLSDPQAFTQAEVTLLNATKVLFTARATSDEEAKAQMPTPGQESKTTTFGQMSLELVSNLVIHEHRQLYVYGSSEQNWGVTLTLEQTNAVTLHAPANNKVLILDLDAGSETVYDGADIVYGNHPAGNVVIERYSMGDRQETHELALPPFQAGMTNTPANQVIDYKLFNGSSELHKNVYSTTSSGYYWYVDARYEKTMTQIPGVDQAMVDRLATPKSALPTGRYEVPTSSGNLAVDLYPEGVVIGHWNTGTGRLLPAWNGGRAFTGTVSNSQVLFVPGTNQLVGGNTNVILNVANRTK